MAQAAAKDKPETTGGEPTGAQRAKIATLIEQLGIEPPEVSTQDEATKLIEELNRLADEGGDTPQADADADADADTTDAGTTGKTVKERPGDDLSPEQVQQLFERAVSDFGAALRIVFDVEELQPSQTPGVV